MIHEHKDLINIMSSSMLLFTDIRLAPNRIPDTATEDTPNLNPNANVNPKTNDFINVTSHEHNDLINIITSSMLFGKYPRLAPIRITDTATEETPRTNLNPNPNDLINVAPHEHKDLINIMSSSKLFGKDPRLAPIRIPDTATEETHNNNPNPNPNNNNKTNPNPNHNAYDLINVTSHEHNDLINIINIINVIRQKSSPCSY